MSYQLHIRLDNEPISESAWQRAVEAVDGVRMASAGPMTIRHPVTGDEISVSGTPTSAELFFPAGYEGPHGQWVPVFHYSPRGSITVNAAFDFEDPDDPVRKAMKALAGELGAVIVGDEGETYEF